jgi:hypothetical protein
MNLRDPAETRDILLSESNKPSWIIDGLGPLKIIEDRFKKSDLVIVIRIPLWVNLLWAVKRQIKSIFVSRKELPTGSNEASLINSIKLFKNIWNVQHGLWLQLDRIFLRDEYKHKVKYVSSLSALNYIIKNGLN